MKAILVFITALFISWNCVAQSFTVGEQLEAIEGNIWYPVTVIGYQDGKYLIHWDGYPDTYDRWITTDKLRAKGNYSVGDRVEGTGLNSDGMWYSATIIDRANGQYKVHWNGFSDSADSWINANQIRPAMCIPPPDNTSPPWGTRRISILYIENQTGAPIRYNYAGDGTTGTGTIYNGQKDYIRSAPIGADLFINGTYYITIHKDHDGQSIVIK